MEQRSIPELESVADDIIHAGEGENTAARIGNFFKDILDHLSARASASDANAEAITDLQGIVALLKTRIYYMGVYQTSGAAAPGGEAPEEETVISEPVDPQYADTETDLVELPDDGGEDGGLQIEAEEVEALEIDASEAVEASLEDISTGDDAPADQDSFVPWYAAALASLTLEMDEVVSCNIPEGSVLLVTGQPGEGLLNVACGALTGVVDATALTALTEDEVLAFMDQVALMEEIALYQDMPEYPLPPVPAQQADAPEVGEAVPGDANPEDVAAGDEDPDFTEPTDDNADDADDEEVPEDQQGTEEPADAENKEDAGESEDGEKTEDTEESEDGEKKEDAEESEDGEKKEDVEEPAEGEAAQSAEESAAAVEKASAEADGKTENKESAEATGSANAAVATDAAAGAAAPASEAGVPASIAVNLSAVNLGRPWRAPRSTGRRPMSGWSGWTPRAS